MNIRTSPQTYSRCLSGVLIIASTGFLNASSAGQPLQVEDATRALQSRYARATQIVEPEVGVAWYGYPMIRAATDSKATLAWIAQYGSGLGVDRPDLRQTRSVALTHARRILSFRQFLDGLPVEYGTARLIVQRFGRQSAVVYASGSLVSRPAAGFDPDRVRAGEALRSVTANAEFAHLPRWTTPRLVIFDATDVAGIGQPVRAWKFAGFEPSLDRFEAFTFFVDAASGTLVEARSEVYHGQINGRVLGKASPSTLPDEPTNPPVSVPLGDLFVTASGTDFTETDDAGLFALETTTPDPVTIDESLAGPWVTVRNTAGANVMLSAVAGDGDFVEFEFNQTPTEFSTAQVNGFVNTVLAHNFFADRAEGFTALDVALDCNVNADGNCNAFFTPMGPSINFFQSGQCVNTAYSSVVAHEFGHFVLDRLRLRQGSFGEGFGDAVALLLYDDPVVGRDFAGPGTAVRDYTAPSATFPCFGEIHDCGEVLGGVWWDMKKSLQDTLGESDGLSTAQQLFVDWSLMTIGIRRGRNSATALTGVEVLIADDDDANLSNGTPHIGQICGAFVAHAIPFSGLCGAVRRIRATCRGTTNEIRATVIADLPEATELAVALDGGQTQAVSVNKRGRASVTWGEVAPGDHEVCLFDCPQSCATVTCAP